MDRANDSGRSDQLCSIMADCWNDGFVMMDDDAGHVLAKGGKHVLAVGISHPKRNLAQVSRLRLPVITP